MRFNLTDKEEKFVEHLRPIFSYVFQTLLVLFLVTLLLREFYPEFINTRISVNWFMFVVILFGVLSILIPVKERRLEKGFVKKDWYLIFGLGVLGMVLLMLKLGSLGWIGYVISVLGGAIIVLLSWLVLTEQDKH